MKMTSVAVSTLEYTGSSDHRTTSKIKYFQNMLLAGWHIDTNSSGIAPNCQFSVKKIPALELDGRCFELEEFDKNMYVYELTRLTKNQVHHVYYNREEHEGPCGMGASTYTYSVSLKKFPDKLEYHSTPRDMYISDNGKRYWVGKEISFEPVPSEYKAIQPTVEKAIATGTKRVSSIWQSKIVQFQQLHKTIAESQAELKSQQEELEREGLSFGGI